MKTNLTVLALALTLGAGLLPLLAAGKNIEAGPKGGRLLDNTSPRAEFLVEKDHTVAIAFYDDKLRPVPAGDQMVTVIAEARGGKTRLDLTRKAGRLVSSAPLPGGDGYLVVVMLKAREDARSQNFRFRLELHECGGCKRAEYACICGH